jgi:tight adherence protein B
LSIDRATIILFSIILLTILGYVGIVFWLYRLNSQNRLKSRINNLVDTTTDNFWQLPQIETEESYSQADRFGGVRGQINRALSFFSTNELRIKIASANWPISDVEFIVTTIVLSLVGLFLGWIISRNFIGGLGLGILLYFFPGIFLERSIVSRRRKFQDQLVNFLVMVRGAIVTGFGLSQALDLASRENPAPISEEFGQVLREMRFGLTLEEALHNLEVRMQSDDLKIVVTAIILNTQIGGNLSLLLDATIETIQDRMQLLGEVRSITSYSRYVGLLISLLPFITALVIYLMNPSYYDTAKSSLVTQIVLILALLGVFVGNLVMRQIMRIRI